MILTAILDTIFVFLGLFLSPLSLANNVSLNSNFGSSLSTAGGYLHSINSIIPVDTMLIILGISLVFESGYLVFKVLMWVIKKIPTIN